MDEDEDDVFGKALQRWPSSHRQIKQTERGPQTVGRPPAPPNGMLPCRMHGERRRLLNGNAGLLLLAPPARSPPLDIALQENLQPMDPPAPRPPQSVETLIGQKLQLIGDQFYKEHMMLLRNMKDGHFREVTDFTELNVSLEISCLQRKLQSVDPTCETARPQTLPTVIHLCP
ncbi:BCL2 modifying factor 1 isoform X1 [Triplophysa rosa]|uniref:BCL2 modifying factor 1 isoform X1 n=2 Tax=Triplophysa rosa TaxID=992332 RepID=UPI0025463541|nr:BCL2 modifying factor 1 isoform X1 [Triplophysa rosa]